MDVLPKLFVICSLLKFKGLKLSTVKLPNRLHITDQGINNIQGKEDELYKTQIHVFSPYFVDLLVRHNHIGLVG